MTYSDSELAEQIGLSAATIHRRNKELENNGVLQILDTGKKGYVCSDYDQTKKEWVLNNTEFSVNFYDYKSNTCLLYTSRCV